MRDYLVDLVGRMTIIEDRCTNSDDSISWHAHREAEAVADPSFVEELADYLPLEKDKQRRQAAYFVLGKLAQKVRAADCASLLLSRLGQESDKYVLSALLDALSPISKPLSLDLTPIYPFLKDDRSSVRHSAIMALSHSKSPAVEELLIEFLNSTGDPYDVVYCQSTLSEIGTAKSISHLKRNVKSRKRDVRQSAQWAIDAIEARTKEHSK